MPAVNLVSPLRARRPDAALILELQCTAIFLRRLANDLEAEGWGAKANTCRTRLAAVLDTLADAEILP